MNKEYLIKEVAELASISIRTLHYYDQIGLLCPKQNTYNQYRVYDNRDLEKLWQILFYKELDFPLDKIKEIVNNKSFDQQKALKTHQRMLQEKRKRLDKLITSIDVCIEKGFEEEMIRTFDQKNYEKYKKEAIEKYGEVAKDSYEKYEKKSKKEMEEIIKEGEAIFESIGNKMSLGIEHEKVQTLIKKWQEHISKNYYECSDEVFKGLGELYTTDKRFRNNINKIKEGLAEFMSESIAYYINCK